MDGQFSLSIVVPMYSSEESIVELVERIRSSVGTLDIGEYEIVLVNDASPDDVLSKVKSELMDEDLVLVDMMRNFGQGNATLAGMEISRGEVVVTIDDDLQFPPEEIGNLLDELNEGRDVVYGIPVKSEQSFHRTLGSRFINLVYRHLFGRKHNRSSFAAIRRPVVDAVTSHSGSAHFLDGLILWYTGRVGTIQVEKAPRRFGRSGWGIRQLVRASLDMITNYSRAPLLLSAWISFSTAFIAMLLGAFYIFLTITGGRAVPGWASIFVAISFFSSVQLFTLGIMGEYIARLQINSNKKPKHLIRSIERGSEDKE